MIDEEMHYLFKFFTDRIHYLSRIMARCQQEGKNSKIEQTFVVFFSFRSTR
jgi:hypothetical protein